MFKVLGQDGKEYGPVGADVVQRWIAEGRATAQTRAQAVDSTEWKTLAEYPEFMDAVSGTIRPPSLPPPPPPVSRPMAQPAMSAPVAAPEGQATGLAIVSLVLAILSPLTVCLTTSTFRWMTRQYGLRFRLFPPLSGSGAIPVRSWTRCRRHRP